MTKEKTMQQLSKNYKTELLLLLIQAVLCVIAFNKFFGDMGNFMFMDIYDGAKNYFTYQAYISQDPSKGMSLVMDHAYPYGDYLFYADLTPTIAVPLRLFSVYVYDISPYAIPIFNLIIILIQWLSVLVVYRILRHFVQTQWILVLLSVCLMWTNPQIFRFGAGHFNLTMPIFILLNILAIIRIYKGYLANPTNYFSQRKWKFVGLGVLLYLAAFVHLYYLPIVGLMLGFFVLMFAIELRFYKHWNWKESLMPLVVIGATCLVAFVAVMGTIRMVDSYYALRYVGNSGYGYDKWKLAFSSMFTARGFNGVKYLFGSNEGIHYESNVYLGAFFLYGLTALLCLRFFGRKYYIVSKSIFKQSPIMISFILLGFLGIVMAMGDRYYFDDGTFVFYNYLNPLFYARKFVKQIEQFRCLARFFWPTFWLFSIVMAYVVDYYWQKHRHDGIRVVFGIVVLLAVVDAKDVIRYQNGMYYKDHFKEMCTNWDNSALKDIDLSRYQAFFPLPYFNTGSEVFEYTVDGGRDYNRDIFSLVLCKDIPMMSIQAARLPVDHSLSFFSVLLNPTPDQELLELLNEKPILVLYHKPFHAQMENYADFPLATWEPARTSLYKGKVLPQTYGMKKLAEDATYIVYEWQISELKKLVNKERKIVSQVTCGAESIAQEGVSLSGSDTSLVFKYQPGTRVQDLTHTGQYALKLRKGSAYGFSTTLSNIRKGEAIEVSIWRYNGVEKGGLILQGGDDFYIKADKVTETDGNWQKISYSFVANSPHANVDVYYWNPDPETVWVDDIEIIRKY